MSLELDSRFRLPDGRLVEVVPDAVAILTGARDSCKRCAVERRGFSQTVCMWAIGCISSANDQDYTPALSVGYPRILKEVEDEQTEG